MKNTTRNKLLADEVFTRELYRALRVLQGTVIESTDDRQLLQDAEYTKSDYAAAILWGVDPDHGICENVCSYLALPEAKHSNIASTIIMSIAVDWERHSGCIAFPVPDPKTPHIASYKYDCPHTKLWGSCEYADLRRELCKFIADQLQLNIPNLTI